VRIVGRDPADARFGAASGCDIGSLRWALEHSRSVGRGEADDVPTWAVGEPERADRDEMERLPSPAELKSWLARSWDLLEAQPGVGSRLEIADAWVEAAATVESLVGSGGLAAVRTRTRAWAMARLRARDPAIRAPRPLLVAGRRWDRLDEAGWAALAGERCWETGALAGSRAGRMRVTFRAEAAALLVAALVRALHTGTAAIGRPVGPGWAVADDPFVPDALFGGAFDDAGFPAQRRILADGERVTDAAAGPGAFRRPSFRDPPQPLAFHPALESGREEPEGEGLWVSELAIHPLPDGRWLLECDGALRRGSEAGPWIRGGLVSTTPGTLVRSCVARVGPARSSHTGVRTPALVFEDLEVRF